MTDTVVNNDQWSEIHSLDNQTDDIHYPPNWLRFDDTIEFPKNTGTWKMPRSATTANHEKLKELHEIIDEQQNSILNHDHEEKSESHNTQKHPSLCQKSIKTFRRKIHQMEHHYTCLPELRTRPTLPRRNSLITNEVDQGVYSLVERGIVHAGEDVTSLVQLGSRAAKLPNLRFTKARLHDLTAKNHKLGDPFSRGDHNLTGFKLAFEPLDREQSLLFPPLDNFEAEVEEKPLPRNPQSTPKESRIAKNRNLWNTERNNQRHRFVLGRDTPSNQVLEGWIIPFKDGVVFKHAPAYQEFHKRFKNSSINLCLEWIIRSMENLLQSFGIQYADVFCNSIIALAQQPLVWPLLKDSLIACIANPDEIIEKMNDPVLKFKNTSFRRDIAASLIQRAFRTYLKRIEHIRLLEKVWATKIFQKYWKIRTTGRALRAAMQSRLLNESTKGCVRLINNLKRDWIQIFGAGQNRVIVQICNWNRPEKASDLPSYYFSRCFPLHDPKVSIIFVCPFLDPLREQSLLNLFDLTHREKNPIRQGRVHFVIPEATSMFQQNTSMTAVTCMNYRIIKEIKNLLESKDALLYTDSVAEWDISLSATLQIPIFGCPPDLFQMLSTKSKARKFLEAAGIKVSSAMLSTAADITGLLANFVKGTYTYASARYFTFIPSFKLNLDYPAGQMPVAYIDSNLFSLKGNADIESFAKLFTAKQAQSSKKKAPPKTEKIEILETAQKELETILNFIEPGFNDFSSFMQSWKDSKGFLHAIPCSDPRKFRMIEYGLTVDLNGIVELIVSTETIFDKKFGACGFFVPQQQLSMNDSSLLLKKVADHCQILGMIGRFTLEIWSWENENGEKEYAANNLKAYFSTTVLKGQTILMASGCKFSSSTHKMIYERSKIYVETKPLHKAKFFDMDSAMIKFHKTVLAGIDSLENRVAFYQDRLIHNTVGCIGRKTANSFFESHGINFDYWSRTGSILPGEEAVTKASIPIITIQRDRYLCMEKFLSTLDTTHSLLSSRKTEQFNTFNTVTERVLYEFLLEKSFNSDGLNTDSQSQIASSEPASFQSQIAILDSHEIRDISKLISQYVPISISRLKSPSDDDSIPRYQISTDTVKLLAEGIPSNIAAEFDPTFRKPILMPPYKRSIKKESSLRESSESISVYKRNSVDNGSNSSVNTIPETSKKQSQMPTLREDHPDN